MVCTGLKQCTHLLKIVCKQLGTAEWLCYVLHLVREYSKYVLSYFVGGN